MSLLEISESELILWACARPRRILLFGPPGIGKSTLACRLGRALRHERQSCACISADPGSPAFGIPGAVSRGLWHDEGWRLEDSFPLCTLDAGRFRLPLISALHRLAERPVGGPLLVDGPGVVRGVAGAELLVGILDVARVDAVIALTAAGRPVPLADELRASGLDVWVLQAASEAPRPGKGLRARQRTARWDHYLRDAVERSFDIDRSNLIGTPPPLAAEFARPGRQIALFHPDSGSVLGEVLHLEGTKLTALLPPDAPVGNTLLVRDAVRGPDGLIETAEPFVNERIEYLPPADTIPVVGESGGPRVLGKVGRLDFGLINGVFGDSLLHLRLKHHRRSLLFDLGDGARLPARIAHQVSDVFISHAHMDHIGGFQWFLRARLRDGLPPCRVYGPPGLATHIRGFLQCFIWDRIGLQGPVFEVAELHGDRLRRIRIQVGVPESPILEESRVIEGRLREEPGFRIRAVLLDHRTPVLAYAFEPEREIKVRRDRLLDRGLEPGPWLTQLKKALIAGRTGEWIALPDGTTQTASEAASTLIEIRPGKKLVYATDFADTAENRERIIALARNAHTLVCESTFREADAAKARRTGHLTTRACGEIAAAARVARLVPFHFSRRYSDHPLKIYEEIGAYCNCVAAPNHLILRPGEARERSAQP